jgi:hypothetical protein
MDATRQPDIWNERDKTWLRYKPNVLPLISCRHPFDMCGLDDRHLFTLWTGISFSPPCLARF